MLSRVDQTTLDRYVDELAAADPAVRDEGAFSALATAITDGALTTAQRRRLGDRMVDRLRHPDPFARSFAPLILACLASTWSPGDGEWPGEWTDVLLTWWTTESDLRGYDDTVGWIHAIAHGADAVGSLGLAHLAPADRLLTAIAERVIARTEFVWRDQEDDRVAAAACAILLGNEQVGLGALLEPISEMFATGEPGPVPVPATNAMHTLRSLYVALGNPVVHPKTGDAVRIPSATELQRQVAATLQVTTPWLFSAADGSRD